jgi:hypothetical protein
LRTCSALGGAAPGPGAEGVKSGVSVMVGSVEFITE